MTDDPALPLLRRLDVLHARLADLVRQRVEEEGAAPDPLRGLYLTPDTTLRWAHRPLPGGEEGGAEVGAEDSYLHDLGLDIGADGEGGEDRVCALARRFGLSLLDVHILLTALAPEVDRRFEPLNAYLNDNVGRRRATVALALELVGTGTYDRIARARFHAAAPLRRAGLLQLEDDPDRPFPGRHLRVPERVVAHLLGGDTPDAALLTTVSEPRPRGDVPAPGSFTARLSDFFARRAALVHLREQRAGSGTGIAVAALQHAGHPVLRWDVPPDEDATTVDDLASVLVREARLRDAALVVTALPAQPVRLLRRLEGAEVPTVLVGSRPFDPQWSRSGAVLPLDLPSDDLAVAETWAEELGPDTDIPDLAAAVAPFRITRDQVRRAVRSARVLAVLDAAPLSAAHVQQAARQQSAPLLNQHTRHVEPGVGWDDLVLPPEPLRQLQELVLRARHRDRVLRDWRMRPGGGRGRGVVALFAGDSGTGKTLSAEVVAGELGVALYVVNLSSIVDKYIGETEKNLDRVFTEADRTDSVLLFDEADAIFGKRSEVNDSHDRYANLESAFLLQRLEAFDGIAVLTTNLRSNIDEAFTRRLDLAVDFPFPDAELRAVLWRRFLAHAPCAPELDLDAVGARFELSGGAIRSAAVTAAYLAAGRDGLITDDDIVTGAHREYQKLGHVVW